MQSPQQSQPQLQTQLQSQPLVVTLFSSLPCPANNLLSWLPSLISALNQQLVSRNINHLLKYSVIFDNCFVADPQKTTESLNGLRFKLIIQLITIIQNNQLKDLLRFVYCIQNMIKFSEPEMMVHLLSKLSESLEPQIQRLCTLVIVKTCLYKPELILSCLVSHANCRYFGQLFLNQLNKNNPHETKTLLKFIISTYSRTSQFFYNNDLKILLDILIRILEHGNTHEVNQRVLESYITLSCSKSFQGLKKYRKQDLYEILQQVKHKDPSIKEMVEQVQNILNE